MLEIAYHLFILTQGGAGKLNRKGYEMAEAFITHTGHKLTAKEEKFIQEYLISGNASQSYIKAYNKDPEQPISTNSVRQLAHRVLTKEYINSEIQYRMSQIQTVKIADAQEILEYFTAVMRGEIKDQFGLEAGLGERTKAAQELAKRQIDLAQKAQANEQPEVKITLNWERPSAEITVNNLQTEVEEQDSDNAQAVDE